MGSNGNGPQISAKRFVELWNASRMRVGSLDEIREDEEGKIYGERKSFPIYAGFEDGVADRIVIDEALKILPRPQRMVIQYRFGGGLTVEETSRKLKISEIGVEFLEAIALNNLRDYLQAVNYPRG